MSKIKQLSFEGKVIYCGLDVHKTNWKINAKMEGIEMAAFSQNPDPSLLKSYFDKNYPRAELKVEPAILPAGRKQELCKEIYCHTLCNGRFGRCYHTGYRRRI